MSISRKKPTRAPLQSSGRSAAPKHAVDGVQARSISRHKLPSETDNIADATSTVRINKALADAGICSRRKAEELIASGLVQVNGVLVTELGHKVSPDDAISVNGQPVIRQSARCYLVMHKPVQVMCTTSDPEGRTTIFDILPAAWRGRRLFSVGRLDYFSEGLLILTDDGPLAQLLSHPSHHMAKKYEVLVREHVLEAKLTTMRRGMTLAEGEKLAPVGVKVLPSSGKSTLLQLTLHQGINRQIRRMCRDLGLTILKLVRTCQGPLELGSLTAGEVRSLTAQEVATLRRAVRGSEQ